MHVGFSLLTLAYDQPTGTGAYANGLLADFARGHGPEQTTVFLTGAPCDDYSEFEGGFVRLAKLPSPRRAGSTASRFTALLPPRLTPRRTVRLMAGLDLLHYPLTIPVPRTQLRTAVTLHDLQHHDLPELFSRAQRAWRRATYDTATRRATIVITVSQHAKGRIVERLGIDPDRIEAVAHGVDRTRFSPEAEDGDEKALAGYRLPERFLLYPAALWPHKNHDRLLAGLAAISDPDLGIVLTGPSFGGLPRLREDIARHRLGERVRYLGFVAPEAIPALYRRATAMIFPSLYEGFGAPTLEAMACGCPVACSSATALTETCGDGALMFDPHSSDSIAVAMERIVGDSTLRGQLREAGSSRVQKFTWEGAARGHRRAFERALALDAPSPSVT